MKQTHCQRGAWCCALAGAVLLGLALTNSLAASEMSGPGAGIVNTWLRQQSEEFQHWDLGGQFRLRYEQAEGGASYVPARDFQANGIDNHNAVLLLREKIHIGYRPAPFFSAIIEGRDSSTSGDVNPLNPGADAFDLHQAYLQLGSPSVFPLTLKVGRQELSYGEERLVGASDWTNTQRVFDAVKLRYDREGAWIEAFASRMVLTDNGRLNVADQNDGLLGLVATTSTWIPWQETQAYVLSRHTQVGASVSPRDIYTVGFRLKSAPGKLRGWDYTVEEARQWGSINSGGLRLRQDAQAASVGGGYTWKSAWASPRLGVEYNYSSGDADPKDGRSETFDNLFPTNHKHYGYLDFVGWRNLHNPRLQASLKPTRTLSVSLDWHWFLLADDRDLFYPQSGAGRSTLGYGRNSGFSKNLGTELNLDATYAVTTWASLRGGYGHFFPGGYVESSKEKVGGTKDANWFYTQLTLNF